MRFPMSAERKIHRRDAENAEKRRGGEEKELGGHDFLEAGVGAEIVEVGVVLGPALVPEAVDEGFFEAAESVVELTLEGVDAGDVVKNAGVFGVDGQGHLGALEAAGLFAELAEIGGAEVQG